MKKILLSTAVACGLFVSSSFGQDLNLSTGWQLKGTESGLSMSDINNSCINTVWKYSGDWEAYSPDSATNTQLINSGITELKSIDKNDGFWVYAGSDCNISTQNNKDINTDTTLNTKFILNNISTYNLDASKVFIEDNKLKISNMRIWSDETDINDSVNLSYSINIEDMTLTPENNESKVYKDLGIFNNDESPYFIKNVSHDIYMVDSDVADSNLSMGSYHTRTITKNQTEFYFDLDIGQVITFTLKNATDDYIFKFLDIENEEIHNIELSKSGGVITGTTAIKEKGKYTLIIEPVNNDSMSISFMFLNANRTDLTTIEDGSYISNSFYSNLYDYAKYEVSLNEGDKITVPKPNSDIVLRLFNENGKSVHGVTGLEFIYTVEETGKHYLVINNKKSWGGSYSGTVNIEEASTSNSKILSKSLSNKQTKTNHFSSATSTKE